MSQHNTYQQDLLRKYIDGSISKDQRHELEKLALDDPFLFEAMEAYSTSTESSHSTKINEVYQDLNNPEEKPRRRILPLRWISAAAGLLLVAAIGFLIQQDQSSSLDKSISSTAAESAQEPLAEMSSADQNDSFEEEMMDQEERSKEKEPRLNNMAGGAQENMSEKEMELTSTTTSVERPSSYQAKTSNSTPPPPRSAPKEPKKTESSSDLAKNKTAPISGDEIRALPTKSIEEIAATNAGLSTSDENEDVSIRGSRESATNYYVDGVKVSPSAIPQAEMEEAQSDEDIAASAPMARKKMAKTEESVANRTIKGKVTDETGEGIIGANVIVEEHNTGTVTDIDGNFQISIPEGEFDLVSSYLGFESKAITVPKDQEFVNIEMNESSMLLDEVVVTTIDMPVNNNAMPLEGYDAFRDYLRDNMIVPDNCNRDEVLLSFTVTADGEVKNITSEIKDACFYEAQRLILDGGKWKTMPPRRELIIEYEVYMR